MVCCTNSRRGSPVSIRVDRRRSFEPDIQGSRRQRQRLCLRRPPLGQVLATAHDMEREHRVVSAVGQTAVPVPATLGVCEDVEVNGAPFM